MTGTITSSEESSAAEGETTSTPPSGASTPPTSVSDKENAAKPTELESATLKRTKNNKRKRSNEQEAVASKKSKKERADAGTRVAEPEAAPTTKKTPLGTFDADQIIKINSLMDDIGKQASRTVEKNAKKGAYGIQIPANAEKGRKKGEPHMLFDDPSTGKKTTLKAAKTEREKAMRDAKRGLIKKLVVAAVMSGDFPNPERWTQDEVVANYSRISKTIDEVEKVGKKLAKTLKVQQKQERQQAAKEEKRLDRERRTAEKQVATGAGLAKRNEAVVTSKLAKLSPDEKAEYGKRAVEKNQTLEEYILRRIEKKAAKRAAKTASEPADLFIVDLEGDTNLANDLAKGSILATYDPLPDGTCPLDPTIWADHSIKSLPKPVREARRKYMEEQRKERKLRAGKSLVKGPSCGEKKVQAADHMIEKELKEQGIKGGATKEQKKDDRKSARKTSRESKKREKDQERGKKDGGRATRKSAKEVSTAAA